MFFEYDEGHYFIIIKQKPVNLLAVQLTLKFKNLVDVVVKILNTSSNVNKKAE